MRNVLACIVAMIALGSTWVYGDCFVPFFRSYSTYSYPVTYAAPYVAPVVIKPAPIYYELGAPQQVVAKQQYAMRNDADYDRFVQFKAFEAGFLASAQQRALQHGPQQYGYPQAPLQQHGQQQPTPAQPGPQPIPQDVQQPQQPIPQQGGNLLMQHCANCHGTQLAEPKGSLFLGDNVPLSGDQIVEVMRRMRLPADHPDVMPPAPEKLPPETKGAILEQILSLHQRTVQH